MGDDVKDPASFSLGQNYLETELYDLLQNDKLMFEFFQEEVVDGLWYWDLTSPDNEWMSPKFWRLFGYDPEFKEHKVHEWQDIIFQEDLAVAQRNLALHLKNPDIPYDQMVRYRHKNGSVIWVRCRGIAIYSSEGEPVRLLGCHLDMTRVMEKQQELLGLQIKYDHMVRRLDELHVELNQNKALNDSLQRMVANDQLSDEFGFAGKQFFIEQTRLLAQNAARLNLSIATIRVAPKNLHGDITQITEFKTFLKKFLLPEIAGGVLYPFSDELYGAVMMGVETDTLIQMESALQERAKAFEWLSGEQSLEMSFRTMPVTDELKDKFLDLSCLLELFYK